MIKIENTEVSGWEAAIRGMRNAHESWDKSDSSLNFIDETYERFFCVGPNDLVLMKRLVLAGSDHAKCMRYVIVTADVVAPRYWWEEQATYKVGTVSNSCSTMHSIHKRPFTLDDFSHEHLDAISIGNTEYDFSAGLEFTIDELNLARNMYLQTGDKRFWQIMIQRLPQSYNQRRTILCNYQNLRAMYFARRHHKLKEWRDFCNWIETLPYSELITGERQ